MGEDVAPEIVSYEPYNKKVDMWSTGVIMYILLCGHPPFLWEKKLSSLYRDIRKGDITFDEESWGNKSTEAKDLISNLLVVNPQKRFDSEKVLKHDWFFREDKHLSKHNLSSSAKNLEKYVANRKFRAAANSIIAC